MAAFDLSGLVEGGALAAIGGACVKLVDWWRRRRRDDAEADVTVGEAWQAVVKQLQADVARLTARVAELETHLVARDRIIVKLAYRLPMTPELRNLLLEIAPAAKDQFDDGAARP